jgi:hypothetical protein
MKEVFGILYKPHGLAIMVKGKQVYILRRYSEEQFISEYFVDRRLRAVVKLDYVEVSHRWQTLIDNGFESV